MPPLFRRVLFLGLGACSSGLELHAQFAASNASSDEIVQLPAFVIEARHLETPEFPVHWYHAEMPGIEILSCLSAKETDRSVHALREQARLLNWTLPSELRPAIGRPLQLIFDARPFASLRVPSKLAERDSTGASFTRYPTIITGLNDWAFASYYLSEDRANAMTELESNRAGLASASPVLFASEAILGQKPIPGWLHRFWGDQREMNYYADAQYVVFQQFQKSFTDKKLSLPSLAVTFLNPTWKPSESQFTMTDARQAGLWFVRWALYDDQGSHREAFWKFIRTTTLHPRVDEAMIRQSFGLGMAELDRQIGEFRQENQSRLIQRFKLPLGPIIPPVAIRDATDAEIGRMLGQWALLAGRHNPRFTAPLLAAARRVLTSALQKSEHDPQVIALLALVELDSGHSDKARLLLESVAKFPDLNARARFELAKLRYADALAKPAAPSNKFDEKQIAEILAPLAPFRAHAPGESDPVALIALAWSHAATPPARDVLEEFVSVARQFPRDDQLLLQTARLCLQQNLNREATELVATGLSVVEKEDAQAAFLKLKAQLVARAVEHKPPAN